MCKWKISIMNNILIFWSFFWISIATAMELDYYWKDYYGHIPEDAFIGDSQIDPIYVGQGYFKGAGVLPATIYHYLSTITATESGNNPIIRKNIKILCTQNPNALQWISVNYTDIKTIQNIHFLKVIEAGIESNVPLYVGKHYHEGTMQIAKVYNVPPYQGLHIPNKSGDGTIFQHFELLVYCTIC